MSTQDIDKERRIAWLAQDMNVHTCQGSVSPRFLAQCLIELQDRIERLEEASKVDGNRAAHG